MDHLFYHNGNKWFDITHKKKCFLKHGFLSVAYQRFRLAACAQSRVSRQAGTVDDAASTGTTISDFRLAENIQTKLIGVWESPEDQGG